MFKKSVECIAENHEASVALDHNTEIELIFPSPLYQDAICAPILSQVGISMESAGNKLMLFTDARTVAALLREDEKMKDVFRGSGIGLVVYGWKKDERAKFLIGALHNIAEKYGSDAQALRYAVFDLHKFVREGMMRKIDPNPFAEPPNQAILTEKFDLAACLEAMKSPASVPAPVEGPRPFGRR